MEFCFRSLIQLDQEQNINDTAGICFASTKQANTIAQNRPSLITKETSTVTNDGFSSLPFGTKISNFGPDPHYNINLSFKNTEHIAFLKLHNLFKNLEDMENV